MKGFKRIAGDSKFKMGCYADGGIVTEDGGRRDRALGPQEKTEQKVDSIRSSRSTEQPTRQNAGEGPGFKPGGSTAHQGYAKGGRARSAYAGGGKIAQRMEERGEDRKKGEKAMPAVKRREEDEKKEKRHEKMKGGGKVQKLAGGGLPGPGGGLPMGSPMAAASPMMGGPQGGPMPVAPMPPPRPARPQGNPMGAIASRMAGR